MSEDPGAPGSAPLPRGRHSLPPEQVAEHQQWRLLAAAGEVLLVHGYCGVSSRRIVRQAKVSSATFYRHFENADDCLLAAHAVAVDCLWDLVRAACAEGEEWGDRLAAACREATAFLASEPALARLLGADVAAAIPAADLGRERFLERLAGLLGSGRELRPAAARELPSGCETHLVGAACLLLGDRVVADEADRLPAGVPELTAVVRHLYAGPASRLDG